MKKLIIAIVLFFGLSASPALAQCNGKFSANSYCGTGASAGPPKQQPISGLPALLPLANGDIFVGNASNLAAPVAPTGSGDCTFTFSNLGVFGFTCLKTNGVSFGTLATQSGTLSGNGAKVMTGTGTFPNGDLAVFDANSNIVDGGAAPSANAPPFGFANCSLAATVSSNNLTVALKDNTGADPSSGSPCVVYFRNSTLSSGSWTKVSTVAALSFTANSGSTFGATNTVATCSAAASCPFRTWVVGINTGSGLALGVVDLTNAAGVLPLNEGGLQSSTTCSACTNATALGTIYSTAGQSFKPIVILGYLEWGNGLATAGTYASAPTIIQSMGPGIRKPGQVVQGPIAALSTSTAQSTSITKVLANPSVAITPTSPVNLIRIHVTSGAIANAGSNSTCLAEISRSTTFTTPVTASVAGVISGSTSGTTGNAVPLDALDAPGSASPITYVPFIWSAGSYNCNWNSTLNSGTPSSYITVEEIMG